MWNSWADTSPQSSVYPHDDDSSHASKQGLTEQELHDHEARHPPLPGNKDHTCTDPVWLALFLLALGGVAYVAKFAVENGDERKLMYGYDVKQNLCGLDNSDEYLFWCRDPNSNETLIDFPMCIAECPTSGSTPAKRACPGPNGTHTLRSDYPTVAIGHWCFPAERNMTLHVLHTVIGKHWSSLGFSLCSDLSRVGKIVLPVSAFVAIITGYMYLYLLDKCAEYLVYVCLLLLVVSTSGTGSWLVYNSMSGNALLGKAEHDLVIGVALAAAGLLMVCWMCSKIRGISAAIGCIEAACECFMEEPTLLFEPFLALVLKVVSLVVFFYVTIMLTSTGDISIVGHYGVMRNVDLSEEVWCYMGFIIFAFLWVMEIHSAASQYVLAWTTQMWYFTPYLNGKKEGTQTCGIFKGYYNLARYHVGTVALGSLMLCYLRLVRVVCAAVVEATKWEGNPVGEILAKCCLCCVTCYARFLASLSKNAYMDVAITSSNFCVAATRSLELLANEVPAVAVLNGTQIIFQICGIGLITCSNVWLTLISMSELPVFSVASSAYYVGNPAGVAAIVGLQAGFISVCFMHVFDTVGDTILYCFASEQRRRSWVDHKAYGSRSELKHRTWWAWLFGGDSESDGDTTINYAPSKLKGMIDLHNAENTS